MLGLVLALGIAVVGAQPPAAPQGFPTGGIERTAVPARALAATPTIDPNAQLVVNVVPTPTGPPLCPPAIAHPSLVAIGDSVMVGAAEMLEADLGDGLYISAAVSRQAGELPGILRARAASGPLDGIVIIHVGTNGYLTDSAFDAIMNAVPQARAVIFINVRVPREWEDSVNSILADGVARHPRALLIDWNRESAGHPEYLKEDGIHLTQPGREVFASMVTTQVQLLKTRWAKEAGCLLQAQEQHPHRMSTSAVWGDHVWSVDQRRWRVALRQLRAS